MRAEPQHRFSTKPIDAGNRNSDRINSAPGTVHSKPMSQQSFAETHAQMSDGELDKVLRDECDLVPDAAVALECFIEKRLHKD